MPRSRPACEIEPVFAIASSRRILPAKSARPGPKLTSRPSFASELAESKEVRATNLADLIPVLAGPVRYLTGMLSNFVASGHDDATSTVRIGVTGSGVAPNYRIDEPGRPANINVGTLHRLV